MSFFDKLKRALGFGPDIDDIDTDDSFHPQAEESSAPAPAKVTAPQPAAALPTVSPEMKERIFDGAVAIFNEALPGFLSASIDQDKQRQRLVESIDKGVDEYLNAIVAQAQAFAEAQLMADTQRARSESEKLRKDLEAVEQQRSTLREERLSADRRRRALAERVSDLEAQLAKAEAEVEQYQLENRGLINKLKVADVHLAASAEGGAAITDASLLAQVEDLNAQLAAAKEESEKYKAEAQTAKAEAAKATEEADKTVAKAKEDVAAAKEDVAAALAELNDSRQQQEIAAVLYSDLQNSMATEREGRIKAEEQLQKARELESSLDEFQRQMAQVEELIAKRDERIARLKSNNKKLREQLVSLQQDKARPRDEGLFSMIETREAPVAAPALDKDKLAAIEEEFECPEWFASEPDKDYTHPLLIPDADFGYKEPVKKNRHPENEAQLTLFE